MYVLKGKGASGKTLHLGGLYQGMVGESLYWGTIKTQVGVQVVDSLQPTFYE